MPTQNMAADFTISSCLSLLKCDKRLEREKGLTELKCLLEDNVVTSKNHEELESNLIVSLTSSQWEEKHGSLMAAGLLLKVNKAGENFRGSVKDTIPKLLEDSETRVRNIAGEVLGALCASDGVSVYQQLQSCIVDGIRDNMTRDMGVAEPDLVEKLLTRRNSKEENEDDKTERPSSPSAAQVFHDTAGWKCLETYMNALQHSVEGCGSSFHPHITADLLDLLFITFDHANRFVRETGYKVLSSIVRCPGLSQSTIANHWASVAGQLATGLSDNWSQVRMSASVATRDFLNSVEPKEKRKEYYPVLIPPMCLNRYYVAEGVRLYSQETWRMFTEGRGIELVEENINNVVTFYIKESQAANHAVREAACACIAELGAKVSGDCLRPHISDLVNVLLDCFKDDSWPVRDAACLACGNFTSYFPTECRAFLEELFPLFLANLEDSIPSVRQGGAAAIASVVKAYGAEMEDRAVAIIRERLPMVAEQPPSSQNTSPLSSPRLHPGLEPGVAMFGVVKRVSGDSDESHTNQQMYSCGSLAPKMKRGGGCMDSDFHKPAQPWEKSEGCIHLLAELSQIKSCQPKVVSLLPLLADTARYKQYTQHLYYFEVLLRQLSVIAKALGKQVFKRNLDQFFDIIFYGIASDNSQLKISSSDCLQQLTQLIGQTIMRGRVEQYNPSMLVYLDQPY